MSAPRSPKDTFITVYGRKPVLEALENADLRVDKVIIAEGLRGEPVRAILDAARDRGVTVQRATAHRVKVLAGNGRHDQGVLADVVAPRMAPVAEFVGSLEPGAPAAVLVLDRLTNPANVGMILRSATAAGLDGVLLPRRGLPAIDPLMIKASAGVAFRAPVLRSATVEEGCETLAGAGFAIYGLDAGGTSLLDAVLPVRVALVLGNETNGLSASVRPLLDGVLAIPMHGGVESLGVASAGAVAAFELSRRRHRPTPPPATPATRHPPSPATRHPPSPPRGHIWR